MHENHESNLPNLESAIIFSPIEEENESAANTSELLQIEIKNDTIILSSNTDNLTQPITLVPHPDVTVTINGNVIDGEVQLNVTDQISYELKELDEFQLSVAKGAMEVFFKLDLNYCYENKLKIKQMSSMVFLEVEKSPREIIVSEIIKKVQAEFVELKIDVPLIENNIVMELSKPTFEQVIIARGIEAINETDESMEYFVKFEVEEVLEETNGIVNFRDKLKIPTVKEGHPMAKLIPKQPGKEGKNVYGSVLPYKKGKTIKIIPLANVSVEEDMIFSLIEGRPNLVKKGLTYSFSVLNCFEVSKDVDMSVGNIYFNGDIIIRGNVKEDMRIEALGNIYIHGNVYSSTIISSQDIFISGTIYNSYVIAGSDVLLASNCYQMFTQIRNVIKQLSTTANQINIKLKIQKKPVAYGKIINTLMEEKFKHLKPLLNSLDDLLLEMTSKKMNTPPQLQKVVQVLKTFNNYHVLYKVATPDFLVQVNTVVTQLLDDMVASTKENSKITFSECSSSVIKSSGCIMITNRGVVNARLEAKQMIIFQSKKSYVKGGQLKAYYIQAGIIGAEKGSNVEVEVVNGIQAMKMLNVLVKVDDRKFFVEDKDLPNYKKVD